MHPASVFAGAAFRSAMLFLLISTAVFSVAGIFILTSTQAAMDDEIRSQIMEDLGLLRDTQADGGAKALAQFIDDATPPRAPRRYVLGMFDTNNNRVAGNLDRRPDFTGWGMLHPDPAQPALDPDYLTFGEKIGNASVYVGRSVRFVAVANSALWRALLLSGLVTAIGALATGYIFSHGVSAKLEKMAATLSAVSRGDTAARLPMGKSNDQVDRVSRQINAHLDRLSQLMVMMRNTVTAIAHDLKSPLSRAYILLQDAVEKPKTQKQSSALVERAQAELETLSSIVDTVLRISRIEASEDQSGFAIFPLGELALDMAQTFDPVIEEAGQSLTCILPPDASMPIFGDRRMVQQMLVNLIENASRYAGARAHIALSVTAEGGDTLLSVTDNGPGIPPEMREQVFQPFMRLNAERDERGAGLGLALVQAIATRHHALVQLIDANPGLTVIVRFPAQPSP